MQQNKIRNLSGVIRNNFISTNNAKSRQFSLNTLGHTFLSPFNKYNCSYDTTINPIIYTTISY